MQLHGQLNFFRGNPASITLTTNSYGPGPELVTFDGLHIYMEVQDRASFLHSSVY